MEVPDPEVEDLLAVGAGLVDRQGEVESDRHGPEHWDHNPEAQAGRHAVIADFHAPLDSAGIDEADEIDLIVGPERNLILEAVEEHEVAADHEAVVIGPDAAE